MADSKPKPNRERKVQSPSKFQALSFTVIVFLVVSFVVTGVASTDLSVPYIHQVADTPENFDGRWACGASSAVMIAARYNRLPSHSITCEYCSPSHQSDFGWYVSNDYSRYGYTYNISEPTATGSGEGTYGYIHDGGGYANPNYAKGYFRRHGFYSKVFSNNVNVSGPDFESQKIKTEVDKGHPIWTSTEFFGGHIVVIKGYTGDEFIVADPAPANPSYDKCDNASDWFSYKECHCYKDSEVYYTWDELEIGSKWIVTANPLRVGDTVEALSDWVHIRSKPDSSGNHKGYTSTGDRGTIVGDSTYGHFYNSDGYTWWNIEWEDGTVGWSACGNSNSRNGGKNWIKKISTQDTTPTLNFPANNSNQSGEITFQWESVSGATNYRLYLMIPGHSSWSSDETTSTSYTFPPTVTGEYKWKVKAYVNGSWSDYSDEWSFYLEPLPAPSLVAPSNDSQIDAIRPTFQWNAVSGAERYRLQVANDSSFVDKIRDELPIDGTSWQLDKDLTRGETYYWRVRPSSPVGEWSEVWSFQVKQATGSLKVTIYPSEARNAGAQWRVQDSNGNWSNWFNSGHTDSDLPVGSYTVEYKDISGWMEPNNHSGTIYENWTSTESGTYEQNPQLSISPTSHDFDSITQGDTPSKTFTVENTGAGTLDWNVSSCPSWLSISNTSGANSGSFIATVKSGASLGSHSGSIQVTSNGGSEDISVSVTVEEPIPTAPGNLTASSISSSQIDLSWQDNSDNEDGFKIYRDGSQIDTVGINDADYSDMGLDSNTEYCYQVSAYNSAGESYKSNRKCATTPPEGPNCKVNDAPTKPKDPDGDDLYEDVNGNGYLDFDDAVTIFQAYMNDDTCAMNNEKYFDFNNNGHLDSDDAVTLVNEVVSSSMQARTATSGKGVQGFAESVYHVVPTDAERKTINKGKTPIRTLDLYLNKVPEGLSGYLIKLKTKPGVRLEEVRPGALTAAFKKKSKDKGNRLLIRAVDFQNEVSAGEKVKLATIEVGITDRSNLVVEPLILDDDSGDPLDSSQTELEVGARSGTFPQVSQALVSPNPASSGPVTFAVKGTNIEGFEVEVFASSGRSVYRSGFVAVSGNKAQLKWDLTDNQGSKLANGLYLYTITVKGQTGVRVQLGTKKLLVVW